MNDKKSESIKEFEDSLTNFSAVIGKVAGFHGLNPQDYEEALIAIKFAFVDITMKILKKEVKILKKEEKEKAAQ